MTKAQKKKKKGCHRISNEHWSEKMYNFAGERSKSRVRWPSSSSEHEYVMSINHLLVCNIQDLMRMKEKKNIFHEDRY